MAKHSHVALAGIALCSAACQGTPIRDLTADERALVEDRIERAEAGLAFVEHLGVSAKDEFVFGGTQEGAESFSKDLHTTLGYLKDTMKAGNIFAYNPDDAPEESKAVEADGFHHDEVIGQDYIALSEAAGTWNTGLLMHEAGHFFGGHSQALNEYVEGDVYVRPDSKEAIDVFADEHDFSYMLSAFFAQVDFEFFSTEMDVGRIDTALNALRRESDDDAYEERSQQWVKDCDLSLDKAAWIEVRVEAAFEIHQEYWDHLGITQEEYGEALEQSRIYEYGREKFDEKMKELKAEIAKERIREMAGEQFRGLPRR